MGKLLYERPALPDLIGLRQIFVGMRSHAVDIVKLAEQIEILEQAKVEIKLLNPPSQCDCWVDLSRVNLRQADIPASLTTQVHKVRFDKLCLGEGRSIQDILNREGLAQDFHAEQQERIVEWSTTTSGKSLRN